MWIILKISPICGDKGKKDVCEYNEVIWYQVDLNTILWYQVDLHTIL